MAPHAFAHALAHGFAPTRAGKTWPLLRPLTRSISSLHFLSPHPHSPTHPSTRQIVDNYAHIGGFLVGLPIGFATLQRSAEDDAAVGHTSLPEGRNTSAKTGQAAGDFWSKHYRKFAATVAGLVILSMVLRLMLMKMNNQPYPTGCEPSPGITPGVAPAVPAAVPAAPPKLFF